MNVMKRKFSLGSVMLATLAGVMICSGPSWVSAEEEKKEGAGDVQERALPRMNAPSVTPGATVAPQPQGAMIQGN